MGTATERAEDRAEGELIDKRAEALGRFQQYDEQIAGHLDCLWKLALSEMSGMSRKTRHGMREHLRPITALRKAQKAALAELFNE